MSSKKRVVTLTLLQECSSDAISHDGTQRKTESSGREGQAKNTLPTSSEVICNQAVYETGSRNGSTVSEGVGLVKPRGLSEKVVIGFPIKQVASCGKMSGKRLTPDSGTRTTIWPTPCVKSPGEPGYRWRQFRECSTTLNISLKKPAGVCSMPFVNSTTSRTCMPGVWRPDAAIYLDSSFPRSPIRTFPRSSGVIRLWRGTADSTCCFATPNTIWKEPRP